MYLLGPLQGSEVTLQCDICRKLGQETCCGDHDGSHVFCDSCHCLITVCTLRCLQDASLTTVMTGMDINSCVRAKLLTSAEGGAGTTLCKGEDEALSCHDLHDLRAFLHVLQTPAVCPLCVERVQLCL